MGRTRSPDSIEAERLYRDGMKLVDIAKKMKVPEGTVRRWKSTQKWDNGTPPKSKKKQNERSDKKANVRKKGGQPGNHNSVGNSGGGPLRNKKAEKHGAYSEVYWDTLDDEEMELISGMTDIEEQQLVMQLQMFSVRERRLMKNIQKYQRIDEENHGLAVDSISKTKKIEDQVIGHDGELIGGSVTETTVTNTKAVMNTIMTFEAELTKVQRAKTRAIEALNNLRLEKTRIEAETAGSDTVNDWIAGVMAEGGDDDE